MSRVSISTGIGKSRELSLLVTERDYDVSVRTTEFELGSSQYRRVVQVIVFRQVRAQEA